MAIASVLEILRLSQNTVHNIIFSLKMDLFGFDHIASIAVYSLIWYDMICATQDSSPGSMCGPKVDHHLCNSPKISLLQHYSLFYSLQWAFSTITWSTFCDNKMSATSSYHSLTYSILAFLFSYEAFLTKFTSTHHTHHSVKIYCPAAHALKLIQNDRVDNNMFSKKHKWSGIKLKDKEMIVDWLYISLNLDLEVGRGGATR